ncbi:MAG: MFS transporter [Candidatus Thermoplasmatota archaeon]
MKGTSRFTRTEAVLIAGAAAVVFTRVFAFSLVLPGFREHGETLAGATDLLIGAALGAYGITMALAQLGLGILSDRLGRKPVLLLGTILFVAGSIGSALADSIWTLLAARLLQGLGGVSSVALAAVGETVPAERRTTAMALVGIPAGLGFFLGFALGPFGASLVGFRGLFWASGVLGVLAILPLMARPLPAPMPMTAAGVARAVSPPVLALCVAGFATNFGMSEVAFFLSDRPLGRGALALVLVGAFVVMGIASKLIDRKRASWQPIAYALTALAAGAAVFLLRGPPALWVGALAFFAGHAVLSATLPSQVSRLAGRSGGRGHGVQLVVAYLGSAAGGVAAGAAASHPGQAALLLASVAALAAIAAITWLRGDPGAALPQPSSEASGGTPP